MATVKIIPDLIETALTATDWRALDAKTDEQIAKDIATDADALPILTKGEIAGAITRTIRKQLGLSQAEFADRFHVPVGTVRDWEQCGGSGFLDSGIS